MLISVASAGTLNAPLAAWHKAYCVDTTIAVVK